MERATLRNGKGSADHNDRTKSSSMENVTHPEKTKENHIFVNDVETGQIKRIRQGEGRLREKELSFYESRYGGSLKRKNGHYKRKGNAKAIKTVEQAYATAPIKETLLQIGRGQAHTREELYEAVIGWVREMTKYANVQVMSVAIHVDEGAPHAHVRWVLEHETDRGDIEINQSAALREMGFEAHNPFDEEEWRANNMDVDVTTKQGKRKLGEAKAYHERYDNPMIAFTDWMRETWYDVLERQGYDIIRETDPKNKSRRNKTTQEYKQEQLAKGVKQAENALKRAESALAYVQDVKGLTEDERARYEAMEALLAEYGLTDKLNEKEGERER